MCIRAGDNELESVKNLMGMSLMAVVADALDAELDDLSEEMRLVEDLQMDHKGERELQSMIADVFDGLLIDVRQTPRVSDLLDEVVRNEFRGLPV